MLTRRSFVTRLGAAIALVQTSGLANLVAQAAPASAQAPFDDALNGVLAFVVPGSDPYSVAQGVTDSTPGAVEAGVLAAFKQGLDLSGPSPEPSLTTSQFVAVLLDQVAGGVNPSAAGFAGLSFPEKMAVFSFLESDPLAAPLAAVLPVFVAYLAYSEVGVFDDQTRTLTGRPIGWELTGYEGVADGRDELVGYYRGQKKAK